MNELKKSWSVLQTLGLVLLVSGFIAKLFNAIYLSPACWWMAGVLAAAFMILWLLRDVASARISAKTVFGVIFCLNLIIILGYGLIFAIPYFINTDIFTSFPWYSGFAFGFYYTWPILLGSGGLWIFLHLREKQENVKDIKLLFFLLLAGTGLWTVMWTVERIVSCLRYPDHSPHPWHATFVYTVLNFGPWLALEWGIYAWMRHKGKNLKPPVQSQPQPDPVKPKVFRKAVNWKHWVADVLMTLIPLAVVGQVMALLWDTRYLAQNVAMALCTAGSVIALNMLAGWLVNRHFEDSRRLHWLALINGVMVFVVLGFALYWTDGFRIRETGENMGLPEYVAYLLGLGYFGPILLGQVLSGILLLIQSWRNPGPQKPGKAFALLLVVILVINCLFSYNLFLGSEYWTEVEADVTRVYMEDYGHTRQLRMLLVSRDHVPAIYDTDYFILGDGVTVRVDLGTRWTPEATLKYASVNMGLVENEAVNNAVQYIAVYIPGQGYVIMMEKDPETGNWVKVQ